MNTFKPEKFRQKKQHKDSVITAKFSRTGRYLISAGNDDCIFVWVNLLKKKIKKIVSKYETITGIWFSENENYFFAGHKKGLVSVYELPKCKLVRTFQLTYDEGEYSSILSGTAKPILNYVLLAAMSENSDTAFIVLENRDFFKVNIKTEQILEKKHFPGNLMSTVAADVTGKILFFGDDLGYIYYIDQTNKNIVTYALHCESQGVINLMTQKKSVEEKLASINKLCISPDASILVSSSYYGGVHLWHIDLKKKNIAELEGFMPLSSIKMSDTRINGISFINNTTKILLGDDKGRLYIWNYKTNNSVIIGTFNSSITTIDITTDNKTFSIGCKDGIIYLYELSIDML